MAYLTQTDLLNIIDATSLAAMVDDYAQGPGPGNTTSSIQIAAICQLASDNADAFVASIYAVPFATPPQKIRAAAIIFAAEMLYQRRLTPEEKNPFKAQADMHRNLLTKIGAGDIPLDEQFTRGFSPVYASIKKNRMNTNIF